MALDKTTKSLLVDEISEQIKLANSLVLIDHSGLSVKAQQELKNRLSEIGATMQVVKNTLFKLAGQKAKASKEILEDTVLSGPTAIVVTENDPVAPLQVLSKFAKEFEVPNLKVGVIEGKFQNKEALITLSKLPGKDALFAQVTGAIASPLYGLTGTLQGNLQKLIYILDQKSKD